MQKIFLIISVFVFFSCKTSKDLHKENTETKDKSQITTVETRTITEVYSDTVTTKKDSLMGSSSDLEANPIIIENDNLTIEVTKKNGVVNAKAVKKEKKVELPVNKTTVENIHKEEKKDVTTKVKVKDKHKVTEAPINWNWLWLLVAALVAWIIWKRSNVP